MSIILECQSIWVEIFVENGWLVEISPQRKAKAKGSGGRAGYGQVCWLEEQGKSAELPQPRGEKHEPSLTRLWVLKNFYTVCAHLASFERRKRMEGVRGLAGRRLVLGRVGVLHLQALAGFRGERDGKTASR